MHTFGRSHVIVIVIPIESEACLAPFPKGILMQHDLEVRRALKTIQTVLGRVSTTAHSRNLEALIDLVELALWEPGGRHTRGHGGAMGLAHGLQGAKQDGGGRTAYWRN